MANWLTKYSYYLISIGELLTGIREWPLVLRVFLAGAPTGPHQISLRGNGLRFRVRRAMDIWSVKESCLDRFYERCGFAIEPGWTVVDVGAGIGEFSLLAALTPGVQVFAFEPFAESLKLLQENVIANRLENVWIYPEAIGGASGSLTLDYSGGEPLQIQSREGRPPGLPDEMTVLSLSLADALARLGIERCDLLKLDCEGAEFAILFNAPEETLQRVRRIVLEYHDDVTPFRHSDLARFLTSKGYQVQTFANAVHSHLGYLRALRLG
jgi:FkbM family methyltransferase